MNDNQKKRIADDDCVQFFQEAAEKYYLEEYGEPRPLDKSFMKESTKKQNRGRWKRLSILMAGALVLFIGISIGTITSNDNQSYADKGIIQRVYESILGIDTDEHDGNGKEGGSSIVIDKMEDIEDAKVLCTNLYVPRYIPDGFDFERLELEKDAAGVVMGTYFFTSSIQNSFSIGLTYMPDGDATAYRSNLKGSLIELGDRTLCVFNNGRSVGVLTNDCMIVIGGDLTQKEMILIGKKLEKI